MKLRKALSLVHSFSSCMSIIGSIQLTMTYFYMQMIVVLYPETITSMKLKSIEKNLWLTFVVGLLITN